MPAGVGRVARDGGARLDGGGGVRAAGEVEPVVEDSGVVGEPEDGSGEDKDGGEAEGAGTELAAAEEKQADAGPGEEGHDPAVVAGEDGCDEDGCDEQQLTGRGGVEWGLGSRV